MATTIEDDWVRLRDDEIDLWSADHKTLRRMKTPSSIYSSCLLIVYNFALIALIALIFGKGFYSFYD